jgi:hypothetical protein
MDRKTCLLLAASGWILALVCVAGCGKGDSSGRVAISGSVTFQGKPLDQGTIQFTSADPGGKQAISGGMIKDGKFGLPADKGVPPGKYRVRITSTDAGAAAAPAMPGDPAPVAKERIPPEYSSPDSKQEVTVTAGGKNEFQFDVK